jgi:hypothetical protein
MLTPRPVQGARQLFFEYECGHLESSGDDGDLISHALNPLRSSVGSDEPKWQAYDSHWPGAGDFVIYLFVVANGFYLFGLLFAAFQYWNLRNQTNPHRAAVLTERIARLNERLNIQQ